MTDKTEQKYEIREAPTPCDNLKNGCKNIAVGYWDGIYLCFPCFDARKRCSDD